MHTGVIYNRCKKNLSLVKTIAAGRQGFSLGTYGGGTEIFRSHHLSCAILSPSLCPDGAVFSRLASFPALQSSKF